MNCHRTVKRGLSATMEIERQSFSTLLMVIFLFFAGVQDTHAHYCHIFLYNTDTKDYRRWFTSNGVYFDYYSFGPDTSSPMYKIVGVGDFSGDWRNDVLFRNGSYNTTRVASNNESFYSSESHFQGLTDNNWSIVGTGYFDGLTDKSMDILWRNSATGDNAIWFMDGTRLVSSVLIQEVTDTNWKIGGAGDFNLDGYTDIVWRHGTNGMNFIWYMQGTSLMSTAQFTSETDTNWDIVAVAYIDNNNKPDLIWRNRSTGDNGIWYMDNTTLVSTANLPWAGNAWKIGAAGYSDLDLDGDSLPDLWERKYFGNLSQTSSGDPDNDGLSNSSEFSSKKDPSVNQYQGNFGDWVEKPDLTWTFTGGSWSSDTIDKIKGKESVRSPYTPDNSQRSVETTVNGPGTLFFQWKVSSESGHDLFKFYIDGVQQTYISGEIPWHNRRFSISSGSHTLKWEYAKDTSAHSGDDGGWLDFIEFYPAGMGATSLADSVDNSGLTWQTSGNGSWIAQTNVYQGTSLGDAAQAGPMGTWQYTDLESSSVLGSGILTFYWKLRSETGGGNLTLYLAGQSSVYINGPSTDWIFERVSVPNDGTIKFRFERQGWVEGDVHAFVDRVLYLPDGDADGLPDQWEQHYFGTTLTQNGTGDYDADGFSNLQEYLNNTMPDIPELRVKITSLRSSSNLP